MFIEKNIRTKYATANYPMYCADWLFCASFNAEIACCERAQGKGEISKDF